eukprot:scaffold3025_cov132-Isochrysis_galbana.AAC.3
MPHSVGSSTSQEKANSKTEITDVIRRQPQPGRFVRHSQSSQSYGARGRGVEAGTSGITAGPARRTSGIATRPTGFPAPEASVHREGEAHRCEDSVYFNLLHVKTGGSQAGSAGAADGARDLGCRCAGHAAVTGGECATAPRVSASVCHGWPARGWVGLAHVRDEQHAE